VHLGECVCSRATKDREPLSRDCAAGLAESWWWCVSYARTANGCPRTWEGRDQLGSPENPH
jgi:hypothetical protein